MPPAHMLVYKRLSLFAKLAQGGHMQLLRLLHAARKHKRSWLSSVEKDLAYLEAFDKFEEMRGKGMAGWCEFFRRNKATAKKAIYGALMKPVDQTQAPQGLYAGVDEEYLCPHCGLDFPTKKKLATHLWLAHAVRHQAHHYATGAHCTVCLLGLHARRRLLKHLMRRNSVCMRNLAMRADRLPDDVVQELTDNMKEQDRALTAQGLPITNAGLPAVRLEGPTLPVVANKRLKGRHPLGVCRGHKYHRLRR
eukprot:TRINITY_DN59356_c0_g1_i1.p1 TRINITY_DN59356_c0_g1~~TRINITY_DN59356_c0_g1_i1.p1  ORF type:complete len:250 (-),score=24.47 TRINITY_DN59356_c0_g1_i1:86-835(-)